MNVLRVLRDYGLYTIGVVCLAIGIMGDAVGWLGAGLFITLSEIIRREAERIIKRIDAYRAELRGEHDPARNPS